MMTIAGHLLEQHDKPDLIAQWIEHLSGCNPQYRALTQHQLALLFPRNTPLPTLLADERPRLQAFARALRGSSACNALINVLEDTAHQGALHKLLQSAIGAKHREDIARDDDLAERLHHAGEKQLFILETPHPRYSKMLAFEIHCVFAEVAGRVSKHDLLRSLLGERVQVVEDAILLTAALRRTLGENTQLANDLKQLGNLEGYVVCTPLADIARTLHRQTATVPPVVTLLLGLAQNAKSIQHALSTHDLEAATEPFRTMQSMVGKQTSKLAIAPLNFQPTQAESKAMVQQWMRLRQQSEVEQHSARDEVLAVGQVA